MISMYSITDGVHFHHLVKVFHCEITLFPLVLLFCGLLSHPAWTPTPHTRLLTHACLHHPGMDNLLTPFRLWQPMPGHSHVWMPSSPSLGSDTLCQAFPPHGCPLLPCSGSDAESSPFMEATVIHLGSNILWQVLTSQMDTLHLGSDVPFWVLPLHGHLPMLLRF